MGRRLGLSLFALGAGVAVLVSAALPSSTQTPSAASASSPGESTRGGTLRLMWAIWPDSVDPAFAVGFGGSYSLLNATCAKLVMTVYDPDTGKPRVVPEVAVDYPKITNGGRTYTFELKRTFRFHTGEPVTARSFVYAFNRDANPKLGSLAAGHMQEIVGADAVIQGKATRISGVQVLGRYRLRIRLKRRTGDFVARLTMPYFCPIMPGTPNREIDKPPGSGSYYIKEIVVGRHIVLERNPHYPRGVRKANPDRIVWMYEADWNVKVAATQQGKNDFTPLFAWPDAVVRGLVDKYSVNRPGGQLTVNRSFPTTANSIFRFNLERTAFKGSGQAPLRKAINYALDRPALVRAGGYRSGRPSDRLLPAALRESGRLYPLRGPDLVTARRWASRAGNVPTTLTLYTANYPWSLAGAQVFASNLKQLGIHVEVKAFELFTLRAKLNTPREPWDVAWFTLWAAYPDPAGLLLPLLRGTEYEAQANAANRLTGAAARAKAWAELEADLMLNDPPVAVYADVTYRALVSRRFGCWSGAPGEHAFRRQENDLDLGAVCKK
ncbi:MAG TPA: ABC transporter substrate-binding protein [Gaiellaceae bacterium]|nr:ABC transporter substrate-binding protein [Gaiellaceae bacterium]